MADYVVITPAYNEQEYLKQLFESVTSQTVSPTLWLIVNDGSSDETGEIIDGFERSCEFLKTLHRKRNRDDSYYAGKIRAFNQGYIYLNSVTNTYDFIANLDADITLYNKYYEDILNQFKNNKKLGIAGGSYRYNDGKSKVLWGGNYVPGSILMARRRCFEQVGGYRPLKYGAEDTLLCIMAEMKGWEVKYFPQYQTVQNRIVGTNKSTSILKARFRQGLSEYDIGYQPFFSLLKFLKRSITEKPYLFSAIARYLGFLSGNIICNHNYIDQEVISYIRKKQLNRLMGK